MQGALTGHSLGAERMDVVFVKEITDYLQGPSSRATRRAVRSVVAWVGLTTQRQRVCIPLSAVVYC